MQSSQSVMLGGAFNPAQGGQVSSVPPIESRPLYFFSSPRCVPYLLSFLVFSPFLREVNLSLSLPPPASIIAWPTPPYSRRESPLWDLALKP